MFGNQIENNHDNSVNTEVYTFILLLMQNFDCFSLDGDKFIIPSPASEAIIYALPTGFSLEVREGGEMAERYQEFVRAYLAAAPAPHIDSVNNVVMNPTQTPTNQTATATTEAGDEVYIAEMENLLSPSRDGPAENFVPFIGSGEGFSNPFIDLT